ncbi:hypothetical protein, partial [Geomonas sp.]|uniref:hypothetical protein n=1 Tax=Geomonas sp. TaxID=2651584 RepID=UPI002B47175F
TNKGDEAVKSVSPFEVSFQQYNHLKEQLRSTEDIKEKNKLFKRLRNLLSVMEFLITQSR